MGRPGQTFLTDEKVQELRERFKEPELLPVVLTKPAPASAIKPGERRGIETEFKPEQSWLQEKQIRPRRAPQDAGVEARRF